MSHLGTGEWFVNGSIFSEWKVAGQSSLLWIHGKRELPPISYSSLRLMVFPFGSGVWEDRDLVRQPDGIYVFRTHGIG